MAAWLDAQGFSSIDKGARSRLLKLIDQLPEVLAWREKLSSAERLNLNHPNSVWRKYAPPAYKQKKKASQGSPLPLPARDKLAKVLGMLGSNADGEVVNAAGQALKILREHNLDVITHPLRVGRVADSRFG
jgi:hypothetical protein